MRNLRPESFLMNQWRVSLRYEITPPDDLQPALRKSATNDLAACVQGRDKRPAL